MSSSHALLVSIGGRASLLASLQQSIEEVFDLMLASPIERSPDLPPGKSLELTFMVGLAGPLSAVVAMRCSSQAAAVMASRMLGIEDGNAGAEVWDAVGEICNMVAGNFKNKVAGLGTDCVLSVPTVITASENKLQATANCDLHMAFLFAGEPILLSLEVHE
ncbi:MAG TPA: chemotaxis protein CheX [Terracidiphilus sp.]|nr:chemotaxis protein CheX [Terracidiphilus sp.]HEV3512245.1 chemotaxis protein CheX [Candidatus Sulfotelmatobacter sp.]